MHLLSIARQAIVAAALAGLALAGLASSEPAAAQSALRSQSSQINRAIQNQIRQAVKPILRVRNAAGEVDSLALSPDGRRLAMVLRDNTVRLWDLRQGVEQARLALPAGKFTEVRLSADGATAITGDDRGNLMLWDAPTGTLRQQIAAHPGGVTALAVSRGRAVVASGGADGRVRLWDLTNGAPLGSAPAPLSGPVQSLAVSRDGLIVASAAADGEVRLWQPGARAAPPAPQRAAPIVMLGFDTADRLVAATTDGQYAVFDRGSGRPAATFRAAPSATTAEISPDGRVIAVSDRQSHVALHEIESGRLIREVNDPEGRATLVNVDPDGRRLFTAGADGRVRVWNLSDGANLAQIISTLNGWAVLDQAGRFDGSQQGVEDVQWEAGQTALPIDNFSQNLYEPGLLSKQLQDRPSFVSQPAAPVADTPLELPPRTSVVASNGPYAADQTVELTVTSEDQGGGIGAVRLLHNGKTLPRAALVSERNTVANRVTSRISVYRATLAPGSNVFQAVAASRERIDGEPGTLTLAAAGATRPPNLHVLGIGINKYRDERLNLDYGKPDALALLGALDRGSEGVFSHIYGYQLIDGAASKAGIAAAFDGLRQTKPEDVLIVYYAGHGEVINNEWYLLPNDVQVAGPQRIAETSISAAQLREMLSRVGARRILVLIDACKSGSSVDVLASLDRKLLRDVGRETGVAILAGARKDQLAVELPALGHGAFTYVLLEGLNGKADRRPRNGEITAAKLLNYSSSQLPSITERMLNLLQVPVSYSRGADFLLRRSSAAR